MHRLRNIVFVAIAGSLACTKTKATPAGQADSLLALNIQKDADTITKIAIRIKARADSIMSNKIDTAFVHDTVIVKPPVPPAGIAIQPGQSIQSASDAYPNGQTFILKSGTHIRQSVKPKDDQVFIGEPGTVMDGQGVTAYAFRAWNDARWVNGVVLKKITIINYNPPRQNGAIWGGNDNTAGPTGLGWTLDSMDISKSSQLAVRVGNRMKVLRSKLHHNGTINIGGVGKSVLVDGVESSYGNEGCPNDPGFESGGSKFTSSDSLIIRNSYAHNNCGPGWWLDINNINYLIENNRSDDNAREGIVTEISYKGVIRNNSVSRNGVVPDPYRHSNWLWNAGIGIHSSPDVEVYGNVLTENINGIAAIQQSRGSGTYGPHIVQNLYVHDNTITQRNAQPAGLENSVSGAVQDVGDNLIFTSRNNRWVHNTYYTANRARPFTWMNTWRTPAEWQAYGHDVTGTINP